MNILFGDKLIWINKDYITSTAHEFIKKIL